VPKTRQAEGITAKTKTLLADRPDHSPWTAPSSHTIVVPSIIFQVPFLGCLAKQIGVNAISRGFHTINGREIMNCGKYKRTVPLI